MKKYLLIICLICLKIMPLWADEGMWIPLFIDKNIDDMQSKGLRLTAEDLYSINDTSLKDAIGLFGSNCTATVISDTGLVMTSHDCAYEVIQSISSIEHDYLRNGFWAKNHREEIPIPGLTISFLVRIEDVTDIVTAGVTDIMTEKERYDILIENIEDIEEAAVQNSEYEAVVKSFFFDNQFFLFVKKVFKDIRLVAAPPEFIGNFGGDRDSWMWPRHSGNFAIFRIYSDHNNQAQEYNNRNIPYRPPISVKISESGVYKNDFTMVYGYPGTTSQYLTSHAIDMITNTLNPKKIELRESKMAIIKQAMDSTQELHIKYANKYYKTDKMRKKWLGENVNLARNHCLVVKKELETGFEAWANEDPIRQQKYGYVIAKFDELYQKLVPYRYALEYINESAYAIDIIRFALRYRMLMELSQISLPVKEKEFILLRAAGQIRREGKILFKNYDIEVDKKLFVHLMTKYKEDMDKKYHPKFFKTVKKKYKDDFKKYVDEIFEKSIIANPKRFGGFLVKYTPRSNILIREDPVYQVYQQFDNIMNEMIEPLHFEILVEISNLNRIFLQGLQEMQTSRQFYPNANNTLRITYGKVDGYEANDGVVYNHYSTFDGVFEKNKEGLEVYQISKKLRTLYEKKDYGKWAYNDTLRLCFVASNHTTNGDSGSPVLNANGNLIGINFDRNWEGSMSDIMFDEKCRNISVDIKYVMFLLDKYANSKHVLDELVFVSD